MILYPVRNVHFPDDHGRRSMISMSTEQTVRSKKEEKKMIIRLISILVPTMSQFGWPISLHW